VLSTGTQASQTKATTKGHRRGEVKIKNNDKEKTRETVKDSGSTTYYYTW
jgi:hypothetical protein